MGCVEKLSFKYIGVGVRQERKKVVMSQRNYFRSIREEAKDRNLEGRESCQKISNQYISR